MLLRIEACLLVILMLASLVACSAAPAPEPRGPVALADLERRFDSEGPEQVVADYRGAPLLVDATIAGIDRDKYRLATVFMLNVDAYTDPDHGVALQGERVRLLCRELYGDQVLGGWKPALRGCVVSDRLEAPVPDAGANEAANAI